ncbi:hypothetical protein IJ102_01555 [Candidatus Saccharibacteria bacterium]|nr:hypothetical protein [Candidatus Saccharibacteria bacterium]
MATKKRSSESKGNVAIEKRAKIDKAQSVMFAAVCGASLVLGMTVAATIYLVKVITYNAKLIGHETDAKNSYALVQKNLESVSQDVQDLAKNKNLESVASNTTNRLAACANFDVNAEITHDNIAQFRTCSALRVVPETVPSEENKTAALASMEQLLDWADGGKGVAYSGISETQATEVFKDTFHTLGIGLSVKDESSKVRSALDMIESSIRNYDLQSASIRFNNASGASGASTIEFSGTYGTYYSDRVNIETHTETLCADKSNKKCPGDTLTPASTGGLF